jgi:hypothetical protein
MVQTTAMTTRDALSLHQYAIVPLSFVPSYMTD